MRAKLTTLSILALSGLLVACSPKAGADASTSAMGSATPAQAMSAMSMPDVGKTGTGTGTITAINKTAGTVTIQHDAIPAIDWPAMTMAFKATPPALLDGLKVGDKISFGVRVKGSDAEVTSITKP